MKFISVAATAALFSVSSLAAEITCKATYRLFDAQKTIEEEVQDLELTLKGGGITKFEGQLQNDAVYVSATVTDETGSVFLTIIRAPDYTNGISTRANISDGFMRLAETRAQADSRVECEEKSQENGDWCKNPEVKEIQTGRYTLHKVECYSR